MDDKNKNDLDSLFNENPFNENQNDFFDESSITKDDDSIEVLSLDDDSNGSSDNIIPDNFKLSHDSKKSHGSNTESILGFNSKGRTISSSSNGQRRAILFFTVVIGVLSLWYAFFAAPLAFNTRQLITKKVAESENNGSWDISFTKMVQGDVVGFAKELATPSLSSTKASFYVSLGKPGDSFTYNITIKNSGTINAKVSDIIVDPKNANGDAVLYYVDDINLNDKLDAGKETVMSVTAKYNPEHLGPAIPVAKNVTVLINYVQRS